MRCVPRAPGVRRRGALESTVRCTVQGGALRNGIDIRAVETRLASRGALTSHVAKPEPKVTAVACSVTGIAKTVTPRARWKGHLDALLKDPNKIKKVKHHEALPIDDMGKFMQALRSQDGTGARALEFTILTATRSGETRGAKWSEIDMEAGVWVVPAERMKANKEHRVPLSSQALALLKSITPDAGNDLVFPAPRGGVLSDMTLTAVLRRMENRA